MVNNKLIAVDEETHNELSSYKVIPREPVGDVVKKILKEYKELKANCEITTGTMERRIVDENHIIPPASPATPSPDTTDSSPDKPLTE